MFWSESVSQSIQDLAVAHALAGPTNGPLDGLFVGLFSACIPPPGRRTVLADLTECVYSGYARQALPAWGLGLDDSAMARERASGLLLFKATAADPQVVDTAIGIFVATAATAGTLKGLELLAGGPFEFAAAEQGFNAAARNLFPWLWDQGGFTILR